MGIRSYSFSIFLSFFYVFGSIALSRDVEFYMIHTYLKYILLSVFVIESLMRNTKISLTNEFFPIIIFAIISILSSQIHGNKEGSSAIYGFIQSLAFSIVILNLVIKTGRYKFLEWAFVLGVLYSIAVPLFSGRKNEVVEEGTRFSGMVENANEYSSIIILSILCAYHLILSSFHKYATIEKTALIIFIIIASNELIFYCGSRSGVLSLIAFLVLVLVYKIRSSNISSKIFFIGLSIFLTIFLISLIKESAYFGRYKALISYFDEGNSDDVDESILARADVNSEAVILFYEKPFLGWGPAQFINLNKYHIYAHNNFFELLVDYGLIGFVLYYLFFIILLSTILKYSIRYRRLKENFWLIIVLIVFLLGEISLVTYTFSNTWAFWGLISGYVYLENKKISNNSESRNENINDLSPI